MRRPSILNMDDTPFLADRGTDDMVDRSLRAMLAEYYVPCFCALVEGDVFLFQISVIVCYR